MDDGEAGIDLRPAGDRPSPHEGGFPHTISAEVGVSEQECGIQQAPDGVPSARVVFILESFEKIYSRDMRPVRSAAVRDIQFEEADQADENPDLGILGSSNAVQRG